MKKIDIELISIGDEILIGQVINTNSSFLSQELTKLGGSVRWITTVGDNRDDIHHVIETAFKRADITITTGGLGPTHDDITKKIIAQFFDSPLVINEEVLQNITQFFRRMGRKVDPLNKEQALVPACASVLPNPVGTAPGLLFEQDSHQLFVLPGVPFEMKAIFKNSMIPLLKKTLADTHLIYKTIKTTGLFESRLFNMVKNVLPKIEPEVQVAFLPTCSGVNIRIGTKGPSEKDCIERIDFAERLLSEKIGTYLYSTDERNMQDIVAELLVKANKKLAVAEFFTSGHFATIFLKASESSKCYKGSKILPAFPIDDVKLIDKKLYSLDLARNICADFESDYGVSIIEFPSNWNQNQVSDTTVIHFGLIGPGVEKVKTWKYRKERPDNKQRAVQFALDMIRRELLGIIDNEI